MKCKLRRGTAVMCLAVSMLGSGLACEIDSSGESGNAQADGHAQLHLLSAGAIRAVATELAATFRKETGTRVSITAGTAGEIKQRALSEPADLVIVTEVVLGELVEGGVLVADSRLDLARVGMGVAVLKGAVAPDVSSAEALKQTLLAAKSLAYPDPANGATAGIHMQSVLEKLGIADEMKTKSVLRPNGAATCEAVAQGEAELGATQISEIVADARVTLDGPLPSELQKITVYSGAITSDGKTPDAARAFLDLFSRPAYRERFAAAGLDYHE